MGRSLRFQLRPLVAASGFSGLVFEVLWIRLLANVVGATALAMTVVIAVFILGLACGALLASRVERRGAAALRLFGLLEAGAGLLGLAVTLVLAWQTSWLAQLDAALASRLSSLGAAAAIAVLLLGPPTLLMGASLPVLLNALGGGWPAREAPTLYALNLAGGAIGAAATGFVLVWWLGIGGTAQVAAALEGLVGLAAWTLAALAGAPEAATGDLSVDSTLPEWSPRWVATAAFVSGLAAFAFELAWGRLAKLYLGDRTLASATLLAVYLACLAAGSLAVPALARRLRPRTGGDAVCLALRVTAVGGILHLLALRLVFEVVQRAPGALGSAAPRVLLTFAALAAPVVVSGTAFPLLLHTLRSVNTLPAQAVGQLTLVNSIASMLGAVLGGYLLPRALGTAGGVVATAAMLLLALMWVELLGGPRGTRVTLALTVAAGLGAGAVAPRSFVTHSARETLVDVHEDEYGLQVLTRTRHGYLKLKNDRSYIAYHLGHPATSYTQEALAYFACLLAPRCDSVLNIGTGYGITAGAFTIVPGVRSITTVEILPYLCREQARFADFNFRYYSDPRVQSLCGDGRHLLAEQSTLYDVIAVNVLDPYAPGSSALFTEDFWRLARRHLRPGGVYVQLMWAGEKAMLAGGLRRTFPQVALLPSGYEPQGIAVALDQPRTEPARWAAGHLSPEIAAGLQRFASRTAEQLVEGILHDAFSPEQQARIDAWAADSGARNTDDHPILEYRWWHGGAASAFDSLSDISYE